MNERSYPSSTSSFGLSIIFKDTSADKEFLGLVARLLSKQEKKERGWASGRVQYYELSITNSAARVRTKTRHLNSQ
jgi:hypothetical protein